MKIYRLLSALLAPIFVLGALVGISSPATASSSDATLSNLAINGTYRQVSGLLPEFKPEQTWYAFSATSSEAEIVAETSDSGATITLKRDSVTTPLDSGVGFTLTNLPVAITELVIEVTSSDLSTKKQYKIIAQRGVMLQPKIVSISDNTLSNMGGDRITVEVQNGIQTESNGVYCYVSFDQIRPDGERTGVNSQFVDLDGNSRADIDNNGRSRYIISTYNFEDDYAGLVGLKVENYCGITTEVSYWGSMSAHSVFNNAFTLFRPSVTAVNIDKANTTPRGLFSVSGLHINSEADIEAVLYDPAKPETRLTGYSQSWYKDDKTAVMQFSNRPENMEGNSVYTDEWKTAGKRTLLILNCGNYDVKNCEDDETEELKSTADLIALGVVMYTTQVDYTPPVPTSVTLSPNKGTLKGGNRILIKGINIMNRRDWQAPVVKFGGVPLTDMQWANEWDTSDIRQPDWFSGVVPEGVAAGSVAVTITNEWGEFSVPVKYTYSGTPVISSIAPASVSNAGGSYITLNGTGFGTIGTPSVTIDGIKSPCVTRISDTKVLAMIPVGASTGSVDVNVISGAGGGAAVVPGTVNLVASTTLPTATKFTPTSVSIGGGEEVTITGTNFGAAGTVGVTVGGNCARVLSSTATSITIETPSGDVAGATDVVIGATTGTVTKAAAITYIPNSGVSSVSPSSIATTATTAQARVQIVGYGFGAKGTIKVGSAAAIAYTSTDSGTKISNVLIPTSAAGTVSIQITPTGAKEPFLTSVSVKAPTVTYVGPNPRQSNFEMGSGTTWNSQGYKVSGTTAGGTVIRIEGTGFGTSGKIKFDNTLVTPTSWTDTLILLNSPALAAGEYDFQIVPTSGPAVPKMADWFFVAGAQYTQVIISKVEALVDNGRTNEPYTFDPYQDLSDVFVVTGSGFTGSNNGATTKGSLKVNQWANENGTYNFTPYDITPTSFKFKASRSFTPRAWYALEVKTNVATGWQDLAIFYVGTPPPGVAFSPSAGLCLKDVTGTYTPGSFTLTGSDVFGASGTITMEGETVPQAAITWTGSEINVNFANLPANLASSWGRKSVVFTPDDKSLQPYRYDFHCGVSTTVTTKLNSSTDPLTIAAGTSYTASATLDNPVPGTTFTATSDGYEYVTAEEYANNGFQYNRKSGLPVGAGEYFVRAIIDSTTYDTVKYVGVSHANAVSLTITGTPITFTPKLTGSNDVEIFYRGQLGDGTNGSNNDISYATATTPADTITKVFWEYRVAECGPWWSNGLPEAPAYIYYSDCSIPMGSIGTYEIRVRSFEMKSGATDRSIYYRPTYEVFTLKIKKKPITITGVTAEKVYDGTTAINIRDAVVTGAVGGETVPELTYNNGANFADPTPGTGKSLTLDGPITLGGGWATRYELTNPNPVFTGTIKKADAVLSLSSSVPSIVMTGNTSVEITAVSRDTRNNQDIIGEVGVAPIVLASTTTSVCTISGTTVTALKSGTCIISGTQAASTNYNAAQAESDRTERTELTTIYVFAAPKTVQVVAEDVTVAVGENVELASQAIGLVGDDSINAVAYDIYQGATLLPSIPTEPGTYKIVPKEASMNFAEPAAYNPTLKYVAGKLIITAEAPTLEAISANQGPESGGNKVVIKGTNLQQVTTVVFGGKTYRKPAFVVNGDGTEITITAPAGKGQVDVQIRAGVTELDGIYTYIPETVKPPVVSGPTSLTLGLQLTVGTKLKGQVATLSGSGLKANSPYTLVIGSKKTLVVSGVTNAKGAFTKKVTFTQNACVGTGTQNLVLTGTRPNNSKVTSEASFSLDAKCEIETGQVVKTIKKGKISWTLSGFLFEYVKADLTPGAIKSLNLLASKIKGAKLVKIYGYTETDTKSATIKALNLILAKDRTVSVMNYLKTKIKGAKYLTYGKGGVNPVSLTNQALNRRVVIEASF
jgi:outer membrane protein OmpA-like peptidoglycan-associated protein